MTNSFGRYIHLTTIRGKLRGALWLTFGRQTAPDVQRLRDDLERSWKSVARVLYAKLR